MKFTCERPVYSTVWQPNPNKTAQSRKKRQSSALLIFIICFSLRAHGLPEEVFCASTTLLVSAFTEGSRVITVVSNRTEIVRKISPCGRNDKHFPHRHAVLQIHSGIVYARNLRM